MKNIYYYASVSKALDNLNEQGFNYDFNIHKEDVAKKTIIMKLFLFTAMKAIQIQMMRPLFLVLN